MEETAHGTLTNKSARMEDVYNLEDTIQADAYSYVEVRKNTGVINTGSSLSGTLPGSGAASREDAPEKLNWFEENTL